MKNYIFILVVAITCINGLQVFDLNRESTREEFCFNFAWFDSLDHEMNVTCSEPKYKEIPCLESEKILKDKNFPNYAEIWKNRTNNNFTCILRPGNMCLTYAFKFNNAIKNITHFCGKMVENKENPIKTGCFSDEKEAVTIEACACQTPGFENKVPCNSSFKISENIFRIILPVVLYISLN